MATIRRGSGLVERNASDDRDSAAPRLARGFDRELEFVRLAIGLEQESVDPGLDQSLALLEEGLADLLQQVIRDRLEQEASGPHRPRDERAMLGCLARERHAGTVDLTHQLVE